MERLRSNDLGSFFCRDSNKACYERRRTTPVCKSIGASFGIYETVSSNGRIRGNSTSWVRILRYPHILFYFSSRENYILCYENN